MADTSTATNANALCEAINVPCGTYWIDKDIGVLVYIDKENDLSFSRTTNAGATWTVTQIAENDVSHAACWFDKETPGDDGELIHVLYHDNTTHSAHYLNIDISDASVSEAVVVEELTTVGIDPTVNKCAITKTVSGNLIAGGVTVDSIYMCKSANDGATWSSIADAWESVGQYDQARLYPACTADDNDAAIIYIDVSAKEASIKMWDDSAGSWTETSIVGSLTINYWYNFDAAVRASDGALLLAISRGNSSATNDIMTREILPDSIAAPTVTAKTDVVTDVQQVRLPVVMINQQNNDVYVALAHYVGLSVEEMSVYYYKSEDDMATWGEPVSYAATPDDNRLIGGGRTITSAGGRIQWSWYNDDTFNIYVNLDNDIEIEAGVGPEPEPSDFKPVICGVSIG